MENTPTIADADSKANIKMLDETSSVTVNLDKLCRLCLAQTDQLVGIFSNSENRSLSLRIMSCSALEVSHLLMRFLAARADAARFPLHRFKKAIRCPKTFASIAANNWNDPISFGKNRKIVTPNCGVICASSMPAN